MNPQLPKTLAALTVLSLGIGAAQAQTSACDTAMRNYQDLRTRSVMDESQYANTAEAGAVRTYCGAQALPAAPAGTPQSALPTAPPTPTPATGARPITEPQFPTATSTPPPSFTGTNPPSLSTTPPALSTTPPSVSNVPPPVSTTPPSPTGSSTPAPGTLSPSVPTGTSAPARAPIGAPSGATGASTGGTSGTATGGAMGGTGR